MNPEKLCKKCDRCGRFLRGTCKCRNCRQKLAKGECYWNPQIGDTVALFDNHTDCDRAAVNAGWRVLSESIGGDTCPDCIDAE